MRPFEFSNLGSDHASGRVVTGSSPLPIVWDDGHTDLYVDGAPILSAYADSREVDTTTLVYLVVAVYNLGLYFVKEMDEDFIDPLFDPVVPQTAIVWRIDGATQYALPQ